MSNVLRSVWQAAAKTKEKLPFLRNTWVRAGLLVLALLVGSTLAGFGYAYGSTPANIRSPKFEHAHFRMQVLVDGKAVNFADQKFQEGYSKDNCNADLTLHPIHFHDNKDQFVHIHWRHITGGQVLKYYGWNYIGGADGLLGYRFDNFPNLQTVPIHGITFPKVPSGAHFYVYTGDEQGFKARSFDDFTSQELEKFFGTTSNVPTSDKVTLLGKLFPTASAHGVHADDPRLIMAPGQTSQEELKRINNLLGNVVIFVQKDKPTDQQVKDRFGKLAPLSESTCAG